MRTKRTGTLTTAKDVYKTILETRNRIIDEGKMDFNEAVEAAVNQQVNKKFKLKILLRP